VCKKGRRQSSGYRVRCAVFHAEQGRIPHVARPRWQASRNPEVKPRLASTNGNKKQPDKGSERHVSARWQSATRKASNNPCHETRFLVGNNPLIEFGLVEWIRGGGGHQCLVPQEWLSPAQGRRHGCLHARLKAFCAIGRPIARNRSAMNWSNSALSLASRSGSGRLRSWFALLSRPGKRSAFIGVQMPAVSSRNAR